MPRVVERVVAALVAGEPAKQRIAHDADHETRGQLRARNPGEADDVRVPVGEARLPVRPHGERRVKVGDAAVRIDRLAHVEQPVDANLESGLLAPLARQGLADEFSFARPAAGQVPERLWVVRIARGHEQQCAVALEDAGAEQDAPHHSATVGAR